MKILLTLSLSLVLLLAPDLAIAIGVENSGGGADDFHPTAAYFRSRRAHKVRLCLETTASFGIKSPRLKMMVTDAFLQWGDYLTLKKINVGATRKPIQTQTEWLDRCDGTENLAIYFGVENPTIQKFRSQFRRPFAFSQLVSEE